MPCGFFKTASRANLNKIGLINNVYQGTTLTVLTANELAADIYTDLPHLLPEGECSNQGATDLEGLWFAER